MTLASTSTADFDFLNDLANDPAIRPMLPGLAYIDIRPYFERGEVISFQDAHGAVLYRRSAPGVFNIHIMFRPPGLGRHAADAARRSLGEMFRDYGAERIDALTLSHNIPARQLAHRMGFKSRGKEIRTVDGLAYELASMSLSKSDFIGYDA